MTRPPKKTKLVQARVPWRDYETWLEICEGQRITLSEALRVAMANFARSVRQVPEAVNVNREESGSR